MVQVNVIGEGVSGLVDIPADRTGEGNVRMEVSIAQVSRYAPLAPDELITNETEKACLSAGHVLREEIGRHI